MVINVITISALCIVGTILCKVLEKYQKEYAFMTAIVTCGLVLSMIVLYISPVLEEISTLFIRTGIDQGYTQLIFKALGVCYISQFANNICKDCGETAIASAVEITGKVSLIILALPLFEELIETVSRLVYFTE